MSGTLLCFNCNHFDFSDSPSCSKSSPNAPWAFCRRSDPRQSGVPLLLTQTSSMSAAVSVLLTQHVCRGCQCHRHTVRLRGCRHLCHKHSMSLVCNQWSSSAQIVSSTPHRSVRHRSLPSTEPASPPPLYPPPPARHRLPPRRPPAFFFFPCSRRRMAASPSSPPSSSPASSTRRFRFRPISLSPIERSSCRRGVDGGLDFTQTNGALITVIPHMAGRACHIPSVIKWRTMTFY